jgi:hypothetical protein
MDTLREEVKSELINQTGKYNPNDRDTNVRIVENIRIAIDELADGVIPSAKHIAEVAIATNENLQIRDFIMGVQLEKDIDYVGQYLELLGNVIAKETAIPLATVFCGYLYQIEEKDYAIRFLNDILEANPEYPLAKLLYRVFIAQWPASEFGKMAQTLHPKVVDTIYAIDSEEVNNDN